MILSFKRDRKNRILSKHTGSTKKEMTVTRCSSVLIKKLVLMVSLVVIAFIFDRKVFLEHVTSETDGIRSIYTVWLGVAQL